LLKSANKREYLLKSANKREKARTFLLKSAKRELKSLPFCRLNANFSYTRTRTVYANRTVPKYRPFFVILMLKTLIWWNLLEKREAFLNEKALKRDICAVRFALTALFSFKK
jgi:hypothetical protein